MKKAVFIDKDGTLIKDVPYNVNPKLIQLEARAGEALQLLNKNGYAIIVVSNQDGIGKGLFKFNDLTKVNEAIQRKLAPFKVAIDAFYYCPHYVNSSIPAYAIDCSCRKPKPGLILRAAKELNINLSLSWMIGDILNDMEAGKNAGCQTVLIDNGNETEWVLNQNRQPTYRVQTLYDAAKKIIAEQGIINPHNENRLA